MIPIIQGIDHCQITEIDFGTVGARAWGWGRELAFNGDRVSVWENDMMVVMPLNCAWKYDQDSKFCYVYLTTIKFFQEKINN